MGFIVSLTTSISETRYYGSIPLFPEDTTDDTREYKKEYYTATLRYLFVCIVQDGLDLASDMVAEFNRIRNSA